jgi:MFS family permease
MIQLIVCRAFQGLGASGVYAVNITMTPELAAPKWLAWVITLNSVTNIMMLVLGLVFGGLISGHTTWRWIFWSM